VSFPPETKTSYGMALNHRILILKEFHQTMDEGCLKLGEVSKVVTVASPKQAQP